MARIAHLLSFLLIGVPLYSERYAVLAGVGAYQNGIRPLEGPAEDIRAIKQMLLEQHYSPAGIVILLDNEATRSNILGALNTMVTRLKAGDHLFFYFSGHGTSAFDKNSREISPAIGPDSGGLVPVDLSVDSVQSVVNSLVIGRRDLRPILARVPSGAQAFVVLDSCYSENSAKNAGFWGAAAPRSIRAVDLVKREEGVSHTSTTPLPVASSPDSGNDGSYPYSNVISLAAAAKTQTAVDIGSGLIQQGARTVDNRPHGALTNSFLLGLSGPGDTNGDGVISYDELFRFVRHEMEKYPHQPQLLTPTGFPLNQPVLGSRLSLPHPPASRTTAPENQGRIRVKLDTHNEAIESKLRVAQEIQLTGEPYDILVRAEANEWKIYESSGSLLRGVSLQETEQVAAKIRAYGKLALLRNWSNPRQQFNVKVDVQPKGTTGYDALRTTFRINEKATIKISTERLAYLLLVDINKDGRVAVLFPGWKESEQGAQVPNQAVAFTVPVTAPAGSDELKLIGFPQRPANWADWSCTSTSCPEFDAEDPRIRKLLEMLSSQPGVAEASLRVTTRD
jgi:uncharacterized caspase-like protein